MYTIFIIYVTENLCCIKPKSEGTMLDVEYKCTYINTKISNIQHDGQLIFNFTEWLSEIETSKTLSYMQLLMSRVLHNVRNLFNLWAGKYGREM